MDKKPRCVPDGPVTAAIAAANAAYRASKISKCYAKKSQESAEGGGGGGTCVGGFNPIRFGNGTPSSADESGTVYIDRDTYNVWQYCE